MSRTIFPSLSLSGRADTWLVRPANKSDCTAADCCSHVMRVLTRLFFLSCERVFTTLTTMLVAGFLNEAQQPGTHADFSVVGCDEYNERKLLSCTTLPCSRQRGRVGDYLSTLSMTEKRADIPWRSKCARGMCEADPDRTRASLVLRRLSLCFSFVFHQGSSHC